MSIDELEKKVRLKEKRTFVITPKCDCGGDFINDVEDVGNIFSSLFCSINTQEKDSYKINHKCNKCGKEKKFSKAYPREKSFEVGLDTSTQALSEYVAKAYEEEFNDILTEP